MTAICRFSPHKMRRITRYGVTLFTNPQSSHFAFKIYVSRKPLFLQTDIPGHTARPEFILKT